MKSFLIISLLFTLSGKFVFSQNSPHTVRLRSLAEAVSMAMQHNPSQAIYQQQQRAADYDYKAAQGYIYPHASGSFDGTANLHLPVTPIAGKLFGRPDSTIYVQFGKRFVYNSGITISEDILDWQSALEKRVVHGNAELTQLQQSSFEQSLKAQVAQTYYTILIAKASLLIAATDSILADSIVLLSKQRLEEGTTDAIAVNTAIINANNIGQNKAQSSQLFDEGIENLKLLLGADAASDLELTDSLQTNLLDDEVSLQLGGDKSLPVYQQQASIAALQSKVQRSVAYPRLAAQMYLGAQQFRDELGLSFDKGAWNGYRYVGVDFSVPIFTGFTNVNKYKSALIQQNIAQLQYEKAKQQSEINDSIVLKDYAHYLLKTKSAIQNFQLYGSNLKLNKQKFDEGIISMDVYLKNFQDYLAAETVYLNNLSQLLSSKATILSRQ